MEMKKPVEWWQAAIFVVGFGITVSSIAVNTSNRLTDHEARIKTLESGVEKMLDKQDKQTEKLQEILIILQNKQDRK